MFWHKYSRLIAWVQSKNCQSSLLSMQTLPINPCQWPIIIIFFITPCRCVQVLEVSCDRGGVCVDSQSHVAVIIGWQNLSTKKRKVLIGWENLSIEKEEATPSKDKRDCVNRFELSDMRNKTRLKPFDLKFIFIYNRYRNPLTKKLLRFFNRSVTFFTTFMGGIKMLTWRAKRSAIALDGYKSFWQWRSLWSLSTWCWKMGWGSKWASNKEFCRWPREPAMVLVVN